MTIGSNMCVQYVGHSHPLVIYCCMYGDRVTWDTVTDIFRPFAHTMLLRAVRFSPVGHLSDVDAHSRNQGEILKFLILLRQKQKI